MSVENLNSFSGVTSRVIHQVLSVYITDTVARDTSPAAKKLLATWQEFNNAYRLEWFKKDPGHKNDRDMYTAIARMGNDALAFHISVLRRPSSLTLQAFYNMERLSDDIYRTVTYLTSKDDLQMFGWFTGYKYMSGLNQLIGLWQGDRRVFATGLFKRLIQLCQDVDLPRTTFIKWYRKYYMEEERFISELIRAMSNEYRTENAGQCPVQLIDLQLNIFETSQGQVNTDRRKMAKVLFDWEYGIDGQPIATDLVDTAFVINYKQYLEAGIPFELRFRHPKAYAQSMEVQLNNLVRVACLKFGYRIIYQYCVNAPGLLDESIFVEMNKVTGMNCLEVLCEGQTHELFTILRKFPNVTNWPERMQIFDRDPFQETTRNEFYRLGIPSLVYTVMSDRKRNTQFEPHSTISEIFKPILPTGRSSDVVLAEVERIIRRPIIWIEVNEAVTPPFKFVEYVGGDEIRGCPVVCVEWLGDYYRLFPPQPKLVE